MVRISIPLWLLEAKKDRLPKNLRVMIEATVVRETEKAVCLKLDGEEFWAPRSVVKIFPKEYSQERLQK